MGKQQTEPRRKERRFPTSQEIMSLRNAAFRLAKSVWEMSARSGYEPWKPPFNPTLEGLEDTRVSLLATVEALWRAREATRGTEEAIGELNRQLNERRDQRREAGRIKRNATKRAAMAAKARLTVCKGPQQPLASFPGRDQQP